MEQTDANTQSIERTTTEKPRRANRRRSYAELPHLLRRHIPDEFEMRGPDSDEFLAKDCNVHRTTVLSMALHMALRDIRRIKEALIMKGASGALRKTPQRETRLELVKRAAGGGEAA